MLLSTSVTIARSVVLHKGRVEMRVTHLLVHVLAVAEERVSPVPTSAALALQQLADGIGLGASLDDDRCRDTGPDLDLARDIWRDVNDALLGVVADLGTDLLQTLAVARAHSGRRSLHLRLQLV